MFEIIFLSVLALVWILFATIQDLKQREVANWLNFSLIIFAIGFRFFYSLFNQNNFNFFYQGLIGLGIFFILGNLFYYTHMFAGGDAKLFIALGAVLPFSKIFSTNLKYFATFLLFFFFIGAFYGIITSIFLAVKHKKKFKKQFKKQFKADKKLIYLRCSLAILVMLLGFIESMVFYLGILIFILPYLYIYAKSVDESCMVKSITTKKLREGDWLYKDLKIGKKTIKAAWNGLTKRQISLIKRKYKKIQIREGIPFVPVFLISFVIYLIFIKTNLWQSFW